MIDSDKKRAIALMPGLGLIEPELEIYARLLIKWQRKINLVGPSTVSNLWMRHFADSWQLTELAPLDRTWADLGSGAGFPGMVVAIAQKRAGVGEMHLIESDSRKAAFLREVSRETGANATVHSARCEVALERVDARVITSRAMAGLADLIELSRSNVEKGALALFLKGRDIGAELTATAISSNFKMTICPSKVDAASSIVTIVKR